MFAACIDQPTEKLLEALAVFMAETIDLTHGGVWPEHKRLQRMSDALAAALDLDMTRHWEANQDFWEAAPKALALSSARNRAIDRLAQRGGAQSQDRFVREDEEGRTRAHRSANAQGHGLAARSPHCADA